MKTMVLFLVVLSLVNTMLLARLVVVQPAEQVPVVQRLVL
jgi:hypothetical protein